MDIEKINEEKQIELLQATIKSEEAERNRIATELHDDVGATLSSVRMYLHKTDTHPELLEQSQELLGDSIRKLRNISHLLQPDVLLQLGLQTAIQSLTETLELAPGIELEYFSGPPFGRFNDADELSVYRVVQELVNNSLQHAQAKSIKIYTAIDDARLVIKVEHNGHGITNSDAEELVFKQDAVGLKNIVNRIKTVNGSIDFAGPANGLYTVTIEVPDIKFN